MVNKQRDETALISAHGHSNSWGGTCQPLVDNSPHTRKVPQHFQHLFISQLTESWIHTLQPCQEKPLHRPEHTPMPHAIKPCQHPGSLQQSSRLHRPTIAGHKAAIPPPQQTHAHAAPLTTKRTLQLLCIVPQHAPVRIPTAPYTQQNKKDIRSHHAEILPHPAEKVKNRFKHSAIIHPNTPHNKLKSSKLQHAKSYFSCN